MADNGRFSLVQFDKLINRAVGGSATYQPIIAIDFPRNGRCSVYESARPAASWSG